MKTIDPATLITNVGALKNLVDLLSDITEFNIPLVFATDNINEKQQSNINQIIDKYRKIELLVPAMYQLSNVVQSELMKLPNDIVTEYEDQP